MIENLKELIKNSKTYQVSFYLTSGQKLEFTSNEGSINFSNSEYILFTEKYKKTTTLIKINDISSFIFYHIN